jgi:hypothetical protein
MTVNSEIPLALPRALLAALATYDPIVCGSPATADPAADAAPGAASQEVETAAKDEAELAAREQVALWPVAGRSPRRPRALMDDLELVCGEAQTE